VCVRERERERERENFATLYSKIIPYFAFALYISYHSFYLKY